MITFHLPQHNALHFVAINQHIIPLNVLSLPVFLQVAQYLRRVNHLKHNKTRNTQRLIREIPLVRIILRLFIPSIFASDDNRV